MFQIFSFVYWLSATWAIISLSAYIIYATVLWKKRHPEFQSENKTTLKETLSLCVQCCLLVLCPMMNSVMAIWVTYQFEDFVNYHLDKMESRYYQNDEE